MTDEAMPYDGDPCGCVMCADEDATLFFKGEAFCLTCWQAAELTRLRALIRRAHDAMSRREPDGVSDADWDHLVRDMAKEVGI